MSLSSSLVVAVARGMWLLLYGEPRTPFCHGEESTEKLNVDVEPAPFEKTLSFELSSNEVSEVTGIGGRCGLCVCVCVCKCEHVSLYMCICVCVCVQV